MWGEEEEGARVSAKDRESGAHLYCCSWDRVCGPFLGWLWLNKQLFCMDTYDGGNVFFAMQQLFTIERHTTKIAHSEFLNLHSLPACSLMRIPGVCLRWLDREIGFCGLGLWHADRWEGSQKCGSMNYNCQGDATDKTQIISVRMGMRSRFRVELQIY